MSAPILMPAQSTDPRVVRMEIATAARAWAELWESNAPLDIIQQGIAAAHLRECAHRYAALTGFDAQEATA